MKIARLSDDEGYRGWFVEWIEEYSQFFHPCNWRTFHPFFWEIEDDRSMGAVEMTFVILGLGFRVRYNFRLTEQVASIQEAITEIKAGTADTIPLAEFLDELKRPQACEAGGSPKPPEAGK